MTDAFDFKWTGLDEFRDAIRHMPGRSLISLKESLYMSAEALMTKSKRVTPVDLGTLRNSGFVEKPRREGSKVWVRMGYGGAASAYALAVHEYPSQFSPPSWANGATFNVGGSKYLERPVNEGRDQVIRFVSARLTRALIRDFI